MTPPGRRPPRPHEKSEPRSKFRAIRKVPGRFHPRMDGKVDPEAQTPVAKVVPGRFHPRMDGKVDPEHQRHSGGGDQPAPRVRIAPTRLEGEGENEVKQLCASRRHKVASPRPNRTQEVRSEATQPPRLGRKRNSKRSPTAKSGSINQKAPQDAALNAGQRGPDRRRREHQPKATQVSAVQPTAQSAERSDPAPRTPPFT